MLVFVLIFIGIPLLEIFLFIQIGGAIGAWTTILAVILTAVLGVHLLRRQGLRTLRNARTRAERDELPAYELLEAILLLASGLLLLTTGFFTDAIGFALLLGKVRYWLVVQFGRFIYSRFQVYSSRVGGGFNSSSKRRNVVIDVDAD